jgi:hypothetical protein
MAIQVTAEQAEILKAAGATITENGLFLAEETPRHRRWRIAGSIVLLAAFGAWVPKPGNRVPPLDFEEFAAAAFRCEQARHTPAIPGSICCGTCMLKAALSPARIGRRTSHDYDGGSACGVG